MDNTRVCFKNDNLEIARKFTFSLEEKRHHRNCIRIHYECRKRMPYHERYEMKVLAKYKDLKALDRSWK